MESLSADLHRRVLKNVCDHSCGWAHADAGTIFMTPPPRGRQASGRIGGYSRATPHCPRPTSIRRAAGRGHVPRLSINPWYSKRLGTYVGYLSVYSQHGVSTQERGGTVEFALKLSGAAGAAEAVGVGLHPTVTSQYGATASYHDLVSYTTCTYYAAAVVSEATIGLVPGGGEDRGGGGGAGRARMEPPRPPARARAMSRPEAGVWGAAVCGRGVRVCAIVVWVCGAVTICAHGMLQL